MRKMLIKLLALVGIGAHGTVKISPTTAEAQEPEFEQRAYLDSTPDMPVSFGYKATWFAIPTTDSAAVVDAFGLEETADANWESGIFYREPPYDVDYKSEHGRIFVAPPLDGWTLVHVTNSFDVGTPELQEHLDAFIRSLSAKFGEAQYYSSYRVVMLAAWIHAVDSEITRGFVYAGGGEGYYVNLGNTTAEELEIGLRDISGLSPDALNMAPISDEDEENDHYWPDEEDPALLAGYWSLNPLSLEEIETEQGTGTLGLIPKPPG